MSGAMDCDSPGTGAPATGRRAVRHTRTRAEILDAAAELITEQGAEAFNLTDLATRAGFSNAASLYRYFSSKKEIMGALMRRGLERLEEHLRGVPADLPPADQLVEFCLAYVDYARAHPAERALLLTTTAVIAPEDRAASLPEEFVNRVFGLIAAVIESGGDTGREAPGAERLGAPARSAPDAGDVFAMLHAVWALAQGMAEYDRLYTGPEREVLRSRHRVIFQAYVEGSKRVWSTE